MLTIRALHRFSLAVCAIAAGILMTAWAPTHAHADVNDFSYSEWNVSYELSKDSDGHVNADVTETITAEFPEFDQNRGIVRGIPNSFEDAPTNPHDISVTDSSNAAVPFEVEQDSGFTVILVGDDSFVQGQQTYVISYSLEDVMLARDDGEADEFYWDIMDLEHLQPVDSFSAEILIDPELSESLTGNAQCYTGTAGSQDQCAMSSAAPGSERVTVDQIELAPQEGVTVAIGFEPGTAVQPSARIPNPVRDALPFALPGAAVAAIVAGIVASVRFNRKHRVARGVVVPQYDVPAEWSALFAGAIIGASRKSVPAQIIQLAVNGALRIEDSLSPSGRRRRSDRPKLRLLDRSRAGSTLGTAMLNSFFPGHGADAVFEVPRNSSSFARDMRRVQSASTQAAQREGYFVKKRSRGRTFIGVLLLVLCLVLGAMAFYMFLREGVLWAAIMSFASAASLIFGIAFLPRQLVLSPQGAEMYEYLQGVKQFINVAEEDRLNTLQSYEGANRFTDGSLEVVHLYEKLLPYAVLFGLEKSWLKTLEVTYEHFPAYEPSWYPAYTAVGIAGFGSSISSLTSTLSSSASYTSSSSGGSTGGGFSGGGGGGGFSGGR